MGYPLVPIFNLAIAPYTTLEVGGCAQVVMLARSEQEIVAACRFAAVSQLALVVLGYGSNVLVRDCGVNGLLLLLRNRGLSINQKRQQLTAAAGEKWDDVVMAAAAHNLWGIECLAGIPGSAGAAPVQNIGAYGQALADTLVSVRCYDCQSQQIVTLSAAALQLAYRYSNFKTTLKQYIVLDITLQLLQPPPFTLISSAQRGDQIRQIRRQKGMLAYQYRSCGSFFVNPCVNKDDAARLLQLLPNLPCYPLEKTTQIKIAAAYLIEQAGFQRGYRDCQVGLSPQHALAVVQYGGASCNQILQFAQKIQNQVKKCFAVDLVLEPVLV